MDKSDRKNPFAFTRQFTLLGLFLNHDCKQYQGLNLF